MQALLRLWLWMTAVVLSGAFIWAYVPILVPILLLTLALGLLVGGIVWAARRLGGIRGGPQSENGTAELNGGTEHKAPT
jgi:hypothetical protein